MKKVVCVTSTLPHFIRGKEYEILMESQTGGSYLVQNERNEKIKVGAGFFVPSWKFDHMTAEQVEGCEKAILLIQNIIQGRK